jgi:serine/threonine-protein kinase
LAERFARERDILAALTHPHIARLYDAGVTAQGQPYLALQYVEGERLTTYCDARALGIAERLRLFEQVLSAVQYAHTQLVVHRDLKPSNILVTLRGDVQLLDFGIAKLLIEGATQETELTQLGGRALTLQYASPEQIAGQAIGTASDVYTLGVVLYELVTGVLPYRIKRDSRAALEDAILSAEPMRPSQAASDAELAQNRGTTTLRLGREIKGDLDTIVLKAMKKNPQERYATVDAFAADLRRYLAGEPVQAQPDSVWYRVSKFVLRNRWEVGVGSGVILAFALDFGLGATAVAMFALAIGMLVAMWQAREARRQARIASAAATRAQDEATTARAVQDFLKQIFQVNSSNQPDPQKARLTTARELLDIGAANIDSALEEVPAAKSEVLRTLGDLYYDLGLRERAIEFHRKRLDTLRRLASGSRIEVAEAAIALCRVMAQSFAAPVIAEREELLAEAGQILDQLGDEDSELRASFCMQHGYLGMVSDANQSCVWAQKAVAIYRRLPPCAAAVEALADYGVWRLNLDQAPQAKALLQEAIELASSVGAHANEHLPQVNSVLGNAQLQLGELGAAIASHRRAYNTARLLNGEQHVNTLFAASFLGLTLLQASCLREATELLGQTLETTIRVRGADDDVVLPMPLYNHGLALARSGRLEEGLEQVTRAIKILTHRSAPASVVRIENQARILTTMGRYAEAEALFEETRASREANGMNKGTGALAQWEECVDLLLATGRVAQAQQHFAPSLVLQTVDPGAPDPRRQLLPARIALVAGELADAQGHAGEALRQIQVHTERKFHMDLEAQTEQILGKTLLALGRAQEALVHLTQAAQLLHELVDPQRSPELADVGIALGQCQLALGRPDLALHQLVVAQAIHGTHLQLGEQYLAPLRALRASIDAIAHTL